MLSCVLHGLAALPVWAKTPPVSAVLVVLGSSVLLTPLVMTLLVLIVAGPEGKRHA